MATNQTKFQDLDLSHRIQLLAAATTAAPAPTADAIGHTLEEMMKALDNGSLPKKSFTGTVIHVDKELSSNRGIIVLKTKVHPEYNRTGQDVLRSARFDSNEADEARNLMNATAKLIGHKVRVTTVTLPGEKDGERGNRHVTQIDDLGPDGEFNPQDQSFRVHPSNYPADMSKWPRLAQQTGQAPMAA